MDELKELFERADAVGLRPKHIATALGVADSTVWRWRAVLHGEGNDIRWKDFKAIEALVEAAEADAELPPAAE